MKKLLFSALFISGIAFQAQAQLKLGVKGGVNLAKLHAVHKGNTPDVKDFKNRVDLVGGVVAQLPVVGRLSLQAEALYSGKGAKLDGQTDDTKGPSLRYFSIPVLAVYNFSDKFGIEAGIEFSSLLAAKQKINGKDTDIKDGFEGKDIGLVAGFQFQVTESLNFDARYVYGLTNVREINFKSPNGSIRYNNQAFQLSLAYFFLK